MGEYVVELALLRGKIAQIGHAELDVGERQIAGHRAGLGDGRRGQIDAGEAAPGQIVRQRNQVAAIATSDFEHAAGGWRRGVHAEEPGDRGQAVRMGLPPREGAICDLVYGLSTTGYQYDALRGNRSLTVAAPIDATATPIGAATVRERLPRTVSELRRTSYLRVCTR